MLSQQIKNSFLDFFKEKGHIVVPSSSLISEDASVLLVTAGMQQFKRYFTGELNPLTDFGSQRTTSVQKCFRTSDIEQIGDESHLSFFEMLGNFSFGPGGSDEPNDCGIEGYFKRSAIHWAYEFLTQILSIEPKRISVSVFDGDQTVPRDEESLRIWDKEIELPKEKIKFCGREDNFWGPTGAEGPCGPTSEIFVDDLEVWNLVFNEYFQDKSKNLKKLDNPGVDTGMGLERMTAVLQGVTNVFETDIFRPLLIKIRELAPGLDNRLERIFCDHLRSVSFLINDGLRPSNKEAGYVLRRLWRRLLSYQIRYGLSPNAAYETIKTIPVENHKLIIEILENETEQFQKTLARGLKELEKYPSIDSQIAFEIYETFGLPPELIKELAPPGTVKNLSTEEFQKFFAEHQKISRAGLEKKFGGHGLKNDDAANNLSDAEKDKIAKLHTATHLLHQALNDLFGNQIKQMGSDINTERLRFDFSFERKLTSEEIKQLEKIINQKIRENLPVSRSEKSREQAFAEGAKAFFKTKYPEQVTVYCIGDYSQEICAGPHIKNTAKLGQFKIIKEEAVAAGIRRIKATVD